MQRVIPITSQKSIPKGGLKPDFQLFADLVGPPVIVPAGQSNGQFNVQQYTHTNSDGSYKLVQVVDNTISLLEQTAFSIEVTVLDPEVAVDPFDVSKLRFKWYRNGAYLYETNNANDFTGVNRIVFLQEQCTPEISGVYTLEITNGAGTTTSNELTVRVYDRANVFELYGNLIQNSNGEAGVDNWDTANGITVKEYLQFPDTNDTFASLVIPRKLFTEQDVAGTGGSSTIFPSVQPQRTFGFSRGPNWANLLAAKSNPNLLTDESWRFIYQPTNLIPNEYYNDEYACFYPAKRYVDDYNSNAGKVGLQQETKQTETYFTREALTQGTDQKATMTQTIDLNNASDFVDGLVCGVDQLVGNFFAYVGLGISSYEYEIEYKSIYKKGPGDVPKFTGIGDNMDQAYVFAKPNELAPYQLDGVPSVITNTELRLYVNTGLNQANSTIQPILFDMRSDQLQGAILKDRLISGETFSVWTNSNGSGVRRFDYSFPSWRYPIVKQLVRDSHLEVTDINGVLIEPYNKGWTGFAKLFASLFYNKVDELPVLYDPNQNVENTALRLAARANLSSSLDQRFAYAEDQLMTNVIQPFNQYFNLNLNQDPTTYNRIQDDQYELLRMLVLLATTQDKSRELTLQRIEGTNNFRTPAALMRKLHLSTNTYQEARQLQDQLYGAVSFANPTTVITQDVAFKYIERILQFQVYTKVLNGVINTQYELISQAAANETLNTLMVDSENLKKLSAGDSIEKKILNGVVNGESRSVRRINIKPRCDDTIDFTFRYIDGFGDEIRHENLEGPSVDDIFAVKEKTLLSWVIAKQLQRSCILPTTGKIPVTYNAGPIMFAVDANNIYSPTTNFIQNTYPAQWRNDEVGQLNAMYYERGASAFFGVNKKLFIPPKTRSIEVTATFINNSATIGLGPDSGLDIYDADQIRELHTNFPPKFFGSNSPKAALAHIKLCLYDNEFKRTAKYPHYYMPRNHIWSELKKYVYTNPNGYFESGRGVSDGGDLTFGYYDYNPPTLTSITTPQPPETDASQNNKNNVEYSNKTNGTGRTS